MLELLGKAVQLLPVLLAVNIALSAIGGVFDAISKAKGDAAPSGLGALIAKIAGGLKKVLDILSANLPH